MADKKISQLTDGTSFQAGDEAVVNRSGTNFKVDPTQFSGFDLTAISTTIADTAVDVFVYDTSRDSDGGAWRKRTQHTSWYNETLNTATRGSRREFPAVAVIVAESDTVTIYDGDDPDLPMWMVFNSNARYLPGSFAVSSVFAVNGEVFCGGNSTFDGLCGIRFLSDSGQNYRAASNDIVIDGGISGRNDSVSIVTKASGSIINEIVNDVAMTVLPDAPIDAATGLPVPTIAVATDGGVSVIKDDGTVVDSASTAAYGSIDFHKDGHLYLAETTFSDQAQIVFYPKWKEEGFTETRDYFYTYIPALFWDGSSARVDDVSANAGALATNVGLGVVSVDFSKDNGDQQNNPEDMIRYTTSTYNTGWMPGDIKGAFLSDTDDTDLVAATPLDDDFSSYADQAAAEAAGWVAQTGWAFDAANDKWDFDASVAGAGAISGVTKNISVTTGKTYIATAVISGTSNITGNEFFVRADNNELVDADGNSVSSGGDGTYQITFVASSSTISAQARSGGFTDGDETASLESFSVKLADADRSVNNNGLIVNGTVTRTAVATGADLVAYSGFSASNYLTQPYNSDLDFGTGDFCVMGWFKTGSSSITMFERCASPRSGNGMVVYMDGTGKLIWYKIVSGTPTVVVTPTASYNNNTWVHFAAIRQNGVVSLYFNGQKDGSASDSTDMTNASAILRLGANSPATSAWTGSLALFRISATAPTAEQIAKIYEDEKFLFQDGAQATLYGASDAVTALAHDPVTDLLHVGTSAGRSVFQGLRRVDNTTDAVGTAISAVDSLVVEE